MSSAIRTVALFEAFKGALVLLAACGLLSLLHHDIHALAVRLIAHTHLNPAAHYPRIFLDAAARLHDDRLRLLALGAAAYSALRFVEAWGLWRQRAWAEWLAAGSGAIYLPAELFELVERPTALHAALLGLNLLVVGVMVRALRERRRRAADVQSPLD